MIESSTDQVKENRIEDNMAWIKAWLYSDGSFSLNDSLKQALKDLVMGYESQQGIIKGLHKTNETLLQAKSNLEYTLVRVGKDLNDEREAHDASRRKLNIWKTECQRLGAQLEMATNNKSRLMNEPEKVLGIKKSEDVPLGKYPFAPSASETMSVDPPITHSSDIKRIQEGDLIRMYWVKTPEQQNLELPELIDDLAVVDAVVIHRPQGAGDDWEFQETKNSRIFSQNPYDAKFRGCNLIVKKQDLGDES